MLVAMLADVHANLPALQATLADIRKRGKIEYILHAGDVIGYGPQPNEVCDVLREFKNFIPVLGNHEHAVITNKYDGLNPIASEAAEWTRKHITKENLEWISRFPEFRPIKLDFINIFLVHGSPSDYLNEYIYPDVSDERLQNFLRTTGADIISIGHSHIPFLREFGNKIVLNVGSVGQPRDRDPRACYVLLDTKKPSLSFFRVSYDVDVVAGKINEVGLPSSLADRLYYGW